MKTFKDKFNATKITSVVYDNAKIYTEVKIYIIKLNGKTNNCTLEYCIMLAGLKKLIVSTINN
jgi:hypothetical protein